MYIRWLVLVSACILGHTAGSPVIAQPPQGRGPVGRPSVEDPAFIADRSLFHKLLLHRDEISRTVRKTERGVETLTESDNPEVAKTIQAHVTSMEKRVKQGRPIHLRDPLFAELFRHADQIEFKYEKTDKGARVTETSDDAYVTQLIQSHADVVSRFLKNGFQEVRKNHKLPHKR